MSKAITRSAGAPPGAALDGFMRLPAQRQIGLLLSLALVVGLLGAAFTYATRPAMVPLLAGMTERDTAEAMDALSRTGFESLGQDSGFGTSRMVENARYHHALEGELGRSIRTLNGVESARVHLALPKPTVFLRDRATPTASVLINLHPGRKLDESQVAGIVHLVASSVPDLDAEKVTVVDQRGRLLTSPQDHAGAGVTGRDLDYVQRLEETYVRRITELLAPVLGMDGFRAQVAAAVDFTLVESTEESFDPNSTVLRSEQVSEDLNNPASATGGIPGALSNQPPPAGVAVPAGQGAVAAAPGGVLDPAPPQNTSRRSTRNFEMDRTVRHTKQAPTSLQRLSVAVVVEHRPASADPGAERIPLPEAELARIEGLVREAVGFDATRGDSVNVVSTSFMPQAELEPVDAMPLWREPWVADVVKQGLLALLALIIVPLVLRPMLKNLSVQPVRRAQALPAGAQVPALAGSTAGGNAAVVAQKRESGEDQLKVAQNMVREDPKLVAQVVKQWVASDGN